ncbi:sensor histidine kinase [Kineosporia mesophila]|uniref:sensor histidine kinase n=1 Tax=Kineosporia mesophila TaxID=566012 RepID=UPI001E2E1321|nr:histidine kinase [Kineosporia mesophila]
MRNLPEGLERVRAFRDVLLALLLVFFAFTTGDTFAVVLGTLERDRPADVLSVILVLAQCLPMIVRRTHPGLALVVISVAWGLHQVVGYQGSSAGLALYIALYSAGAHLTRRRGLAVAGLVAGYLALAVAMNRTNHGEKPIDYLTFVPVLVLFWLIGEGVRARTRAEAARRAAQKREAVAQERAHIARELHDVVTHHVTAMVVQAEALPYLLPGNPDKVRDGLGTISTTGRSAMTDLRELLDVLHDPGTPTDQERSPAHEPLEVLVERARAAGQDVTFAEHGAAAPLPTGLSLALQRVVQESLTNALKHAPDRTTTVTLTHSEDELDVAVVTSGGSTTPSPRRPWARSGRGINGMRDRVAAFGGELTAGQEPDGSFAVRAKLPRRPAA